MKLILSLFCTVCMAFELPLVDRSVTIGSTSFQLTVSQDQSTSDLFAYARGNKLVCGVDFNGKYFVVDEKSGKRKLVSRSQMVKFLKTTDRVDKHTARQALFLLEKIK